MCPNDTTTYTLHTTSTPLTSLTQVQGLHGPEYNISQCLLLRRPLEKKKKKKKCIHRIYIYNIYNIYNVYVYIYEKKKINVLKGFCLRVVLFIPIRGMGGGWGSWPPDWVGWSGVLTHYTGTRRVVFGVGNTWSLFPARWQEGFRYVFLTAQTRGRLFVPARVFCEVRTVDS